MTKPETTRKSTQGPEEKVFCPRCATPLASEGSLLVHNRWCRRPEVVQADPPSRNVRRKRLFNKAFVGLGAGSGPRREDLGVLVADTDGEACVGVAGTGEVGEVMAEGMEWTSEATSVEVLEAMRRVLLDVARAAGAKTTDQIIKLLHHPSFRIDDFKHAMLGINSHRELRDDADQRVEQKLLSLRFRKEKVMDSGEEDASADMWVRDPVDVIRRQVNALTIDGNAMNSLIYDCASVQQRGYNGEAVYAHPMSTRHAARVFNRVRETVRKACARGENGVGGWEDGYDFVMFLQCYSDKSSQTLKTSSHTHFPLHVAIHNTSLHMKERLIRQGDCVVGYLPTDILWEDEEAMIWENDLEDAVSGRGSRGSRLRILQGGLEKCLDPLLTQTVTGFVVRDSSGQPMRCHPVLWSYVTDLPEGWDVSSGVHGRCSRCEVRNEDLCSTEPSACKEACEVMTNFEELERELQRCGGRTKKDSKVKTLREGMWDKSIAPVRPYLLSLGDNYGVDLFKCLRYELMHNIHLGLTRTMLTCMSERLRSNNMVSKEFKFAKAPHNFKKFSTIRTAVLTSLNNSMELMDRQSPFIDFKICFKSNQRTVPLNGLFQDKGIASMLEANDFKRILQVMPFLGATCDRMCGEPGTIAKMYVEYVELVFVLTRNKVASIAFSDKELRDIRRRIRKFMGNVHELFGEHQKSDMALPKMHALMHIADDMEEGGLLAHYLAEAFEESHKIIKGAYEEGSRRGQDGHVEAVRRLERNDFLRMESGTTSRGARTKVVSSLSKPRTRTRGARTKTKEEAMEVDNVAVTRSRIVLPVSCIQDFLRYYRGYGSLTGSQKWPKWVPQTVRDLLSDLGGPRAFVWFMEKLELGSEDSLARSNSAYVSGYPYPVPVKNTKGETILITEDRPGAGDAMEGEAGREVQRIVAAHSFHGTKHPVQNFVMVEAADAEATQQQLHASVRSKYTSSSVRSVYIAKVLAFLSHRRKEVAKAGEMPENEAVYHKALIQYMDICVERDEVDKALGCAKLRWAQEEDGEDVEEGVDTMRCMYDVVDVCTIRGLVHVVRGDYGLGKTLTYQCEGDRHWSKCWFYLNRFKLERSGARTFIEEQPEHPEQPRPEQP